MRVGWRLWRRHSHRFSAGTGPWAFASTSWPEAARAGGRLAAAPASQAPARARNHINHQPAGTPQQTTCHTTAAASSASAQQQPAGQPAPGAAPDPNAALDWLVRDCGASPSRLKVERRYMGPEAGWGLVAAADVEPEEVLLSVPLTAALTSEVGRL